MYVIMHATMLRRKVAFAWSNEAAAQRYCDFYGVKNYRIVRQS